MKIAFFVDAFPDLAVTFIINQVAGLIDRGHEVHVFASRPGRAKSVHPDVQRLDLIKRTTYFGREPSRKKRLLDLLTTPFTQPSRAFGLLRTLPPFCSGPEAKSMRYFYAARGLPERFDFDVVHCHFGPNGTVAAELAQLGMIDCPIVTTFHGYDMRLGVQSDGAFYKSLRRKGTTFLSISDYNLQLLRQWGFDTSRIQQHRVGVNLTRFAYRGVRQERGDQTRILSVANLVPVKGHDVLLKAIHRLRKDGLQDFELRIVGEGEDRPRIERLIKEYALESVVTLLGGRDRDGVLAELNQADLFVLPSLAEATPVALMEAQAIGLPVLATRVGAVDEVIVAGESGLLVEPGDPEVLSQALARMIASPDRWAAWGEAGRRHVEEEFDIERLVEELIHIYEQAQENATL